MLPLSSAASAPGNPDAIPLAEFVSRIFVPQRLTGRSARYAKLFGEAVVWLQRYLERPPTMVHLVPDVLAGVNAFIAGHGYTAARVQTVKKNLTTLGKHAWRLGLLDRWRPAPRCVKELEAIEPPPAGTLAALFHEHVRPLRRRGRRGNPADGIAAAVAQFDRFLERHATPDDITPKNVQAFRESLLAAGRTESTAFFYSRNLRRVARYADPERFADRRHVLAPLPPPAAGSVREYFETIYRPERLVGSPSEVLEGMRRTLRRLRDFCGGRDLLIAELNDATVADFLTRLRDGGLRKLRHATLNQHRGYLFAIWNHLHERRLVSEPPRVRRLRAQRDAPDAWSIAELQRMLQTVDAIGWKRPIAGIPAAVYWRAAILTVWHTALRRGTIVKLRRVDLDAQSGWLNVPGDCTKTGVGGQHKLGAACLAAMAALDAYAPNRTMLFPWPHRLEYFGRPLRRIVAVAGIAPSTRRVATLWHKLRRSHATHLAAAAGLHAAANSLGHSSAELTRRHYIDPRFMPGQNATELLPSLTGAGTPGMELVPVTGPMPIAGELAPPSDEGNDALASLAEARELLRESRFHLAAWAARIALERWLQSLAEAAGIQRVRGTGQYVVALIAHDVIPADQKRPLLALHRTACRAAHTGRIKAADATALVEGLATFVVPRLSP